MCSFPSVWLLFYKENLRFTNKQPRFQSESISLQSCLTLCAPMDCSPPGSSVHGILQARILEWVTVPFSRWIFLSQGSNPGLLHYRQILCHLSHQRSSLDSKHPPEFLCLAESQNPTFLLLKKAYLYTLFYEMETFQKQLI